MKAKKGFFKKLGDGRYEGKSGKVFNKKQVELFYAGNEKFPGQKNAPKNPPKKFPKPKKRSTK